MDQAVTVTANEQTSDEYWLQFEKENVSALPAWDLQILVDIESLKKKPSTGDLPANTRATDSSHEGTLVITVPSAKRAYPEHTEQSGTSKKQKATERQICYIPHSSEKYMRVKLWGNDIEVPGTMSSVPHEPWPLNDEGNVLSTNTSGIMKLVRPGKSTSSKIREGESEEECKVAPVGRVKEGHYEGERWPFRDPEWFPCKVKQSWKSHSVYCVLVVWGFEIRLAMLAKELRSILDACIRKALASRKKEGEVITEEEARNEESRIGMKFNTRNKVLEISQKIRNKESETFLADYKCKNPDCTDKAARIAYDDHDGKRFYKPDLPEPPPGTSHRYVGHADPTNITPLLKSTPTTVDYIAAMYGLMRKPGGDFDDGLFYTEPTREQYEAEIESMVMEKRGEDEPEPKPDKLITVCIDGTPSLIRCQILNAVVVSAVIVPEATSAN